jgi:voltage-gated potassium channel
VDRSDLRRIAIAVAAIAVVFAGGAAGFAALLHESWHEALYRAVVTATLTGLDSTPRGTGAELLTIGIALSGVAIFGYLVAGALEAVAHEVASETRRTRRRLRMIDELKDHFIICGYGRVGRRAAEEFEGAGVPFVVLDFNPDAIEEAKERGVLFIEGRGSEDEDLARAGLDRAKGLLASADSDAENMYITLSARAHRPELMIVARASDEEAERKLFLAGASRVVRPFTAAGIEMAKLALKPQVAAFLELVSTHAGPDLRFEELEVVAGCQGAEQSIRELAIRRTTGAVVIAVKKADGRFDITPDPDERIEVGDVVIAIGTKPELHALEDLFAPRAVGV